MSNFRRISLMILLIIIAASLNAQSYNNRRSFGLHFGTSSGNGYAMRWMGEQYGLQLTLGAYTKGSNKVSFPDQFYESEDAIQYTPDADSLIWKKKNGRKTVGTIAINGIFVLDHFNRGRFYVMGGASVVNGKKKEFSAQYKDVSYGTWKRYERVSDEPIKSDFKNVMDWTLGIGPGLEFSLTRHFRIALEVPVTYDSNDDIIMYIPQVGFYYYFK